MRTHKTVIFRKHNLSCARKNIPASTPKQRDEKLEDNPTRAPPEHFQGKSDPGSARTERRIKDRTLEKDKRRRLGAPSAPIGARLFERKLEKD